jgi:hypothetical protein
MDQTVSSYRKLVTDHRHQISRGVAGPRRLEQHAFIAGKQADFEAWFLRYRTRVFSPRWLGSVRRSTWVLRFETLEHDFEAALVEAGVDDPAPLPRVNATERHGAAFVDAFTSEAARRRAATVFGPFMADFGYRPPDEWRWRVPRWASWEYAVGHRARTARAVGLHGAAARLTRPHT